MLMLGILIISINGIFAEDINLATYSGTTFTHGINLGRIGEVGSWGDTIDASLTTKWGATGYTSHQYAAINSIWVQMSFDVPVDLTSMEFDTYGDTTVNPYSNLERLQYFKDGSWGNVYSGVARHSRQTNSGSGDWKDVTAVRFISSLAAKTWGVGATYYVYDFKAFGTPVSPFQDSGLRIYDGTDIIKIAAEIGTPTSPLRIYNGSDILGISLVDPSDPDASKIRIKTSSGIKALRKL